MSPTLMALASRVHDHSLLRWKKKITIMMLLLTVTLMIQVTMSPVYGGGYVCDDDDTDAGDGNKLIK